MINALIVLISTSICHTTYAQNNNWKLRFHAGFSKTNYKSTDLHVKSSDINTTIHNFKFVERTSANHFNPVGKKLKESFTWLDEPTNTFTFSFENNNNAFYLTVYHPKYLKSFLYKKSEQENGEENYTFAETNETDDFSNEIPEGMKLGYIGNTHKRMDYSLGYGRKFNIRGNGFTIKYIPRVDAGISVGAARSVRIVPGVTWDDHHDNLSIQGINGSIGHRIEIERGRISIFVDQRLIYSKMHHEFYDGDVSYTLVYQPTTFGVAFDLFERKIKSNP